MSWKSYLLGDVLKRKKSIEKILPEKEYKLVTIKLYHKGVCLRRVAKGSEIGSTMSSIKEGDFVLSGIDARNGAFGIVPKELDGAIITNDFWCLELDEEILGREFFLYLTSTDFFDHICKQSSDGTTQRIRLQKDKFLNFRISIPSISEQSKILERLKSCGSKNSSITSELTHQLDLVKQLRQSFLREAMQGKLVKQDPKDGNALDLLEKIKIEKAKLGKKEKSLPPIKNEEIPFEIPENWVWCRLGDVINISSGDGLTSSQMDQNGRVPVYGGNGINGTHNKFNINKETIVVGRVGYYCGCVHLTQQYAWVTDNAFITSYPEKYINREFLIQLLKWADLGKQQYAGSQPVISGIRVYPKLIPLPPLAEQNRIVKKLEELMKYCDDLESNIKQSKEQNEKLLQQVLREALSGESSM